MSSASNCVPTNQLQPGTRVASLPRPASRVHEVVLNVHGITSGLEATVDVLEARLHWVRTPPPAASPTEVAGPKAEPLQLLCTLHALAERIQALNTRLSTLIDELDV